MAFYIKKVVDFLSKATTFFVCVAPNGVQRRVWLPKGVFKIGLK